MIESAATLKPQGELVDEHESGPTHMSARDGNSSLFEDFYRNEFTSVVGLAYVLSGDRHAAEELAQESFVAAFRNWSDVQRLDQPSTWVRRVVCNQSVSHVRRRIQNAKLLLRIGGSRDDATFVLDAADQHFWELVRKLPKRQAQCIALYYFEDHNVAEIALILGCSQASVKTHLVRGRESLRSQLELGEQV